MAWNKLTRVDPHKACVSCGYSGDNLEIYEQTQQNNPLGKQHLQNCKICGCVTIFYLDEDFEEFYGKIYKLVDLEAFDEMIRSGSSRVTLADDDQDIIENMMRFSKHDLGLLKRFAKGEAQAVIGIIDKLISMETRYRLSRDQILKIVDYLRLNKEYY